jgi:HEAT repeat protein
MYGRTQITGGFLALALMFVAGRWSSPPTEVLAPAEIAVEPQPTVPDWRIALKDLRSQPSAHALRADALHVLNTADADLALAEAVDLLGWVGEDADAEWLRSLAVSRDAALALPAVRALGRLGTDAAVDALLSLIETRDLDHAAIDALGTTGHPRAWASLIGLLDHPQRAVTAAHAVARFGTPAATRRLTDAFHSADDRTANGIALALARCPDDRARAELHSALRTGDTLHRNAALAALAQLRDQHVLGVLLRDLKAGGPRRQATAAHLLGTLGDPAAIHPLHRTALEGGNEARSAAVTAISQIEGTLARAVMLELIDVGPEDVATQAVWSLRDPHKADALSVLTSSWNRRSWNMRAAIGQRLYETPWDPRGVPSEVLDLARLELRDPPPSGRLSAVGFLLRYGDADDTQAVSELLRDGPSGTRYQVLYALADVPGSAAMGLLVEHLTDPDPHVQQAAARALLERNGAGEQVQYYLISAFQAASSARPGGLEDALAQLGTPEALAALRERVEHGTTSEWRAATSALTRAAGPEHLAILEDALKDETDSSRRRHTYQMMLVSRYPAPRDLVDRVLADPDPSIQVMGTRNLATIGPPARETLLELVDEGSPEVRRAALNGLAQAGGSEAEARIFEAISDPDLAYAATEALGQLGTRPATEVLVALVQGGETAEQRAQAVRILAWNPVESADAAIAEALWDDDPTVRNAAVSSLEGLGTTAAANALAEVLDDPDDPDLARAAAQALQRLGGQAAEDHADLIDEATEPPTELELAVMDW